MPPELPSANVSPVQLRPLYPRDAPVEAVAPGAASTLPRPLTSLIGREAEVAAARAMLMEDGVRLLTLTGPGGVGKTRLSLRVAEEVAESFADGVAFVPLAAITDPDLVLPTIARSLGLREDAARPAAELLADFLRQRRLLLVLDNVEQVRPAGAHLAVLLAACPGLVALATSRALLRVDGEQRFLVAPLALPGPVAGGAAHTTRDEVATIEASAAVQLFVVRAQAVERGFALSAGNAAVISAICRRLDGLPLAIELAAAWVRVMAPTALLARLEHRLPLLHGGAEDQPARLRTMRDAIAWSYDHLSADEAELFRRLAIFVAGFTLDAAEWVAGAGLPVLRAMDEPFGSAPQPTTHNLQPTTLDLIASLVDKSLLQRSNGDGEDRYGMLETVREYGLEQLAARGETEAVAARHAAWCAGLADGIRQTGRLSQGRGLATLEAEHPNLRAALGWLLDAGETTAAMHLAAQLAEFWLRHCHIAEGQMWLERTLAADDDEPTAARAEALVGLSMLQWLRPDLTRGEHLLAEAEAIARAIGNNAALAYARLHQGYIALFRDDLDLALARAEEGLTACAAIPQEFSCHGALWLSARSMLARGEIDQATNLYERLLASARAGGDEISIANVLCALAILARGRGEYGRMLAGYAEAATVCRGFGDRLFASHCLDGAAVAAAALGHPEPAARLYAAADIVRTMTVGAPRGPGGQIDPFDHAGTLAAARAALGAERFAAAWAAGAALTLDEAIAEAAALAHGLSVPERGLRTAHAALTSREQEVLRRLAVGMTDKEIATALTISRRTVSSHVEAIRAKLDAPSRTAAVAIAVRDRLV